MKYYILTSILLVLFPFLIKSQSYQVEIPFKTDYFAVTPFIMEPIQTNDGGVLLAAECLSTNIGIHILSLIKTDTSGTVQWSKDYSFPDSVLYIYNGIELPDNGFMFTGSSTSGSFLLRLNQLGQVVFYKYFDLSEEGESFFSSSVGLINETTLVIAGTATLSYDTRGSGILLSDLQGNLIDNYFYLINNKNAFCASMNIIDDGILLPSMVYRADSIGRSSAALLKLDFGGLIKWAHEYDDGIHFFRLVDKEITLMQSSDKSLFMTTGFSSLPAGFSDYRALLIHIDSSGNIISSFQTDSAILNSQILNINNSTNLVTGTVRTSNGEFFPVVLNYSEGSNTLDGSIINTGSGYFGMRSVSSFRNNYLATFTCDSSWRNGVLTKRDLTYDVLCYEYPYSMGLTPVTLSDSTGSAYFSLVFNTYTDTVSVSVSSTIVSRYCTVNTTTQNIIDDEFIIAPNPVSDFLTIDLEKDAEVDFELTDMQGKIIKINHFTEKYNIDMSYLPQGLYIISVKSENRVLVKKIIKI